MSSHAGKNRIPVILVHSSASSGRQWRALKERLEDRFDVYAPDLTGYGNSPDAGIRSGFEGDLALIGELVEQQDQNVHLVGHSYGGLIAIRTAFDFKHHIRSLSLFEPVCFHLLEEAGDTEALAEITSVRKRQTDLVTKGELNGAAKGFIDYWMGDGAFDAMPEEGRRTVAGVMPKIAAEWPGGFTQTTLLADYEVMPWPVLLMRGSQTTLAARRVVDLIRSRATRARFLEIARAGHMAPITDREPVNDALVEFLENV